LLRTPGISLSRNGGYGTDTSLRIRGANSGQTVLVIDGMRLSDPSATDGGYNFANLFADDIARIEILRGPQAILWGSSSIGGVIAVQTRQAQKPLEGSFSVEGGSRGTAYARGAGRQDRSAGGVGSLFPPTAFRPAPMAPKPMVIAASRAAPPPPTAGPAVSLDLRGYYAHGASISTAPAGDAPIYGTEREWTAYAGLNLALLDGRFANRMAAVQGDTARRNYDPRRTYRAQFRRQWPRRRYEYQGTFTPPRWPRSCSAPSARSSG
jgi:vitamin B12 transporter